MEQVFEISSNQWLVHSKEEDRAQIICETSTSPVRIHQRTEVCIPSGCKLPLQDYILYAQQEEYPEGQSRLQGAARLQDVLGPPGRSPQSAPEQFDQLIQGQLTTCHRGKDGTVHPGLRPH